MMINDNDIQARLMRHRERLKGLRPAIDGDNKACSAVPQADQRVPGWAIAFEQTIWDVIARL